MEMNNNDITNVKILTVQEVADILRIHRTTVSRYAVSGELKSHVIGSRRLFKTEDVWDFFDKKEDIIPIAQEEY